MDRTESPENLLSISPNRADRAGRRLNKEGILPLRNAPNTATNRGQSRAHCGSQDRHPSGQGPMADTELALREIEGI